MVMALITTFATTPLVMWLYPPWYQKKIEAWKRGEIDWDGNVLSSGGDDSGAASGKQKGVTTKFSKVTVLLRLESLPSVLNFINLMTGERLRPAAKIHKSKIAVIQEVDENAPSIISKRPLVVHGMRLVELTQRSSAVMQVSEVDELQERDPVVNVFRSLARFLNVAVSTSLSIAPDNSFAEVLIANASAQSSDLLLIPWSETGAISDSPDTQGASLENRFVSHQHNLFVNKVLDGACCTIAIMVNRGFGGVVAPERTLSRTISYISIRSRKAADTLAPIIPVADPSHHVFFPFFGGEDDCVALRFVLQLASKKNVTATIVRIVHKSDATTEPDLQLPSPAQVHRRDLPTGLSTSNIPTRLSRDDTTITSSQNPSVSEGSTDVESQNPDSNFFQSMADSLSEELSQRVVFETFETSQPLHYAIFKAREEVGQSLGNAGDLVVVGRSQRGHGLSQIREELVSVLDTLGVPSGAGAETRKCLGDVAEAVIVSGIKASVLVLQAGGGALGRAETITGAKEGDFSSEAARLSGL